MRCDITTCSSAHISLLVSGSAQTCFDDQVGVNFLSLYVKILIFLFLELIGLDMQLLESHIKSALIEKTQLVHAVPNSDDKKSSWLNPLNSVSIACGAPVFEVCMRMPTWAAQVFFLYPRFLLIHNISYLRHPYSISSILLSICDLNQQPIFFF